MKQGSIAKSTWAALAVLLVSSTLSSAAGAQPLPRMLPPEMTEVAPEPVYEEEELDERDLRAPAKPKAVPMATSTLVLPVVGEGAPVDLLVRLDKTLRKEAERAFGAQLVKEGNAEASGCDRGRATARIADVECATAIGAAAGAGSVIAASAGPVEGSPGLLRVLFRQFDVATKTVRRTAVGHVTADGAPEVSALLTRLRYDEAAVGNISLPVLPQRSIVLVDGVEAPLEKLPAGLHEITISAPGYLDGVYLVDVLSGTSTTLEVRLKDAPPPPPPPPPPQTAERAPVVWGFITAGGVVAVLGTAGIIWGLVPRFEHAGAIEELNALDAQVRADPTRVDALAGDIAAARATVGDKEAAWFGWGLPLLIASCVVTGLGVGAFATGVTISAAE